jgi:hypothetical protein
LRSFFISRILTWSDWLQAVAELNSEPKNLHQQQTEPEVVKSTNHHPSRISMFVSGVSALTPVLFCMKTPLIDPSAWGSNNIIGERRDRNTPLQFATSEECIHRRDAEDAQGVSAENYF